VRVRVVDQDGSPVERAQVTAGRVRSAVQRVTDDEGRALCELDDPPGTPISLEVDGKPRNGLLPGRVETHTSQHPGGEEVVLRPREPVLVTILVRGPGGAPLAPGVRATIRTHQMVIREAENQAVVGVDPALSPMFVHVKAPGYAERLVMSAIPADGVMEVVIDPLASIRCRLVGASGSPVTDEAFVRAFVPPAATASGKADGSGVFVVQGVAPGCVQVTAGLRSGQPTARRDVLVEPGGTVDMGTLVLGELRVITGRVTAGGVCPLGGARVTAHDGGEIVAETWSHGDGSFRLKLAPWFAGSLLARKAGYGAAHGPAGEDLRLTLAPEGCVRLTLRRPRRPFGWSLVAQDPTTGFRWEVDDWVEEDDDRVYVVKGLPPGRLVLVVDADPPPAGEVEVVVRAGETVPATVVVPE
jgi:hypothetical protein